MTTKIAQKASIWFVTQNKDFIMSYYEKVSG